MTKTIRFCFFCGTGYSRDSWKENFVCDQCQAIFIPPIIIKETQSMLIEAIQNFSTIPLTDKKSKQAAKRKQFEKRI